jgi:hypothetical protein
LGRKVEFAVLKWDASSVEEMGAGVRSRKGGAKGLAYGFKLTRGLVLVFAIGDDEGVDRVPCDI